MSTIEASIADVKDQMADAKQKGDEKKFKSLKITLATLQIQKHAGTQPTLKRPLGPTSKLVDPDQYHSEEFFAVWGSRLTNPEFCLYCKNASAQQTGSEQERNAAFADFCSKLGIVLSALEGESVEAHQVRTRPLINMAGAIMRLGELLYRLNDAHQRQTSGMPIDAGHLKKLEDVMKFLLKGKYAQIALDLISQFPPLLPFFVVMANTIADEEAAEAAVREQEKQTKAAAKAAAFGGGGAAVPSVGKVQSFLKGPAVVRGGGVAVARGGGAAVGGRKDKSPCQRHALWVPHGTDVSRAPKPIVTIRAIPGIFLFYNEGQEAVAQEAARMLGTALLEGAARERANYLSHQSFLTAMAEGKKREL
jgi:hypothetical protein